MRMIVLSVVSPPTSNEFHFSHYQWLAGADEVIVLFRAHADPPSYPSEI